ncbi:hypothetical protein CXB51_019888 [Gossypium anomalum]|uniref:RNase H type-1 domain-containing protein n=1 Tax=Gossypium anomalum TaxID=47600 RepID=A0A8J6D065_9ROSI|nr:hypothetical protein CXB51_019888 [Gossypium anomalum]
MDWVADLILQNPNRWNRDLIYSTFTVEEADRMVSLPIPITNQFDKVVWFSENSGIYSVKSGYKMLLDPPNLCKSSTHAIRDYLSVAQVWFKLDVQWLSSMVNSNFNEWLNWLLENSTSNRKDALWFFQNKFVHEKKMQSSEEISFDLEYRGSALNLKHPQPRSMVKWMPPLQGWVKINVDAGLSVAKKRVVSGFIIRNEKGFIMGSGFKGHNLVRSVVIAEAFVVLHGLQFELDLGFTNDILESDSRLVAQNVQQMSEDYSESRPFTWDAKNLARKFHFCRFQFIAREGNRVVHAMAVEGLQTEGDSFWVEDAPLKALEVADSDRRFSRPP